VHLNVTSDDLPQRTKEKIAFRQISINKQIKDTFSRESLPETKRNGQIFGLDLFVAFASTVSLFHIFTFWHFTSAFHCCFLNFYIDGDRFRLFPRYLHHGKEEICKVRTTFRHQPRDRNIT